LRELTEMRQKLVQLLSKMEGNDKLEELLANVLNNTDKAMSLAKELGITVEALSNRVARVRKKLSRSFRNCVEKLKAESMPAMLQNCK